MGRRRTHAPRSSIPRPLVTADAASIVIGAAASVPIRAETVCLLMDDAHLPLACLVIEGGGEPDDVFPVAELLQELCAAQHIAHVVLTSCRPGHGYEEADIDRWYELSAGLDELGVVLVEWFIRDERLLVAVTPLVGEVSRWPDY